VQDQLGIDSRAFLKGMDLYHKLMLALEDLRCLALRVLQQACLSGHALEAARQPRVLARAVRVGGFG